MKIEWMHEQMEMIKWDWIMFLKNLKLSFQFCKTNQIMKVKKTLEHVKDHYVIFTVISQFAYFAHQNKHIDQSW